MLSSVRTTANGISAALLAALFLTFLLQIVSRYILENPFGWTLELCLILWIWIVFWGNAFTVKHKDQVTFDLLYQAAPSRLRRTFALTSAIAIFVAVLASIYPTWDYINFMEIQKSAALRIEFRTIFVVYMIFLIAISCSYGWRVWQLARGEEPDETHP